MNSRTHKKRNEDNADDNKNEAKPKEGAITVLLSNTTYVSHSTCLSLLGDKPCGEAAGSSLTTRVDRWPYQGVAW